MNKFVQVTKTVGGFVKQNSSTILTCLGVAGCATSIIMGVKATPKAMSLIDEYVWEVHNGKDADSDETLSECLGLDVSTLSFQEKMKLLTWWEVVKVTWKAYLPTAVMGLVTVGCVIGSHHISARRNAALASLYGITEAAFREYQSKVIETFGKSKELKVRDEIAEDKVKNNPLGMNEVIVTGRGEVLCYDTLSGRYFKNDIDKINRALNVLNRRLRDEMFISLNDLYDELGLAPTKLGDEWGWHVDHGDIEIRYSATIADDGQPCIVLNYTTTPKYYR